MSPQNRPLTYSYSATAGTVTGTGTTAQFSSTGARPACRHHLQCIGRQGPHGYRQHQRDHRGSAAAAASAHSGACSISFATDTKRPTRVDNEAKACLDQVALDLQQQADAKAVVVGESTAKEKAMTAKQRSLRPSTSRPRLSCSPRSAP